MYRNIFTGKIISESLNRLAICKMKINNFLSIKLSFLYFLVDFAVLPCVFKMPLMNLKACVQQKQDLAPYCSFILHNLVTELISILIWHLHCAPSCPLPLSQQIKKGVSILVRPVSIYWPKHETFPGIAKTVSYKPIFKAVCFRGSFCA